jgi:hypothetical protein
MERTARATFDDSFCSYNKPCVVGANMRRISDGVAVLFF